MVRLVFRPYVHIMPSSCTSEWLRSSRTLSHPFNQYKHSSPSFGSDHRILSFSHHNAIILSLVRVSRRVGSSPIHSIHFHFSSKIFSHFNHSTSSLSVIQSYLAFDAHTTASGCTTKQPYSSKKQPRLQAIPPLRKLTSISPRQGRPIHNSQSRLPHRLMSFHSPLLRQSYLVSSPPFTDMLKSKGSPCAKTHHSDIRPQDGISSSSTSFIAQNANQSHEWRQTTQIKQSPNQTSQY